MSQPWADDAPWLPPARSAAASASDEAVHARRTGRAAASARPPARWLLGWPTPSAAPTCCAASRCRCSPPGAGPLRVLHLSDLHLTPRQRRERAWVRGLAALEPDLVVNTGDNLAHVDAVPALDALGGLLDRPGVFVLGSNDYFAPRPKNPRATYGPARARPTITGVRLPTAAARRRLPRARLGRPGQQPRPLDVGGLALSFVGVDDPHLRYDRFPPASGDGAAGADLHVGVAHAPYQRVLNAMVDDGAGLLLAGHTHGGQLRARVRRPGHQLRPGPGARSRGQPVVAWRRASRPPPPDRRRLAARQRRARHVPLLPVRFCCRPEASLLTLTPATADPPGSPREHRRAANRFPAGGRLGYDGVALLVDSDAGRRRAGSATGCGAAW